MGACRPAPDFGRRGNCVLPGRYHQPQLVLTADQRELANSVLTWTLGSSGRGTRWDELGLPAALLVILLPTQARLLNALLSGEESAATLGVDTTRTRRWLFVLVSLVTGVLVALDRADRFCGSDRALRHAQRWCGAPQRAACGRADRCDFSGLGGCFRASPLPRQRCRWASLPRCWAVPSLSGCCAARMHAKGWSHEQGLPKRTPAGQQLMLAGRCRPHRDEPACGPRRTGRPARPTAAENPRCCA